MASTVRNTSIKRMEKEIMKESKDEESSVKQELKELARLEKDVRKARKSAGDAVSTLSKRERYEHKTAKAMNNALHEHDVAVARANAAEKDVKLKYRHRDKLLQELEAKKVAVENAIQSQVEHDKIRETKVAHMRGVSVQPELPTAAAGTGGLPGQSGPAVDNSGHPAGYGVDYNRTTLDSEGNAQG